MHELPPPDTTIRRRRGYQELDTEADNEEAVIEEENASHHAEERDDDEEREAVELDGWHPLVWSFGFSTFVSVSVLCTRLEFLFLTVLQLAAYFFPVLFAIPLFGVYLAKQWLWYFTPSLSYIGQGQSLSMMPTSQGLIP